MVNSPDAIHAEHTTVYISRCPRPNSPMEPVSASSTVTDVLGSRPSSMTVRRLLGGQMLARVTAIAAGWLDCSAAALLCTTAVNKRACCAAGLGGGFAGRSAATARDQAPVRARYAAC